MMELLFLLLQSRANQTVAVGRRQSLSATKPGLLRPASAGD